MYYHTVLDASVCPPLCLRDALLIVPLVILYENWNFSAAECRQNPLLSLSNYPFRAIPYLLIKPTRGLSSYIPLAWCKSKIMSNF